MARYKDDWGISGPTAELAWASSTLPPRGEMDHERRAEMSLSLRKQMQSFGFKNAAPSGSLLEYLMSLAAVIEGSTADESLANTTLRAKSVSRGDVSALIERSEVAHLSWLSEYFRGSKLGQLCEVLDCDIPSADSGLNESGLEHYYLKYVSRFPGSESVLRWIIENSLDDRDLLCRFAVGVDNVLRAGRKQVRPQHICEFCWRPTVSAERSGERIDTNWVIRSLSGAAEPEHRAMYCSKHQPGTGTYERASKKKKLFLMSDFRITRELRQAGYLTTPYLDPSIRYDPVVRFLAHRQVFPRLETRTYKEAVRLHKHAMERAFGSGMSGGVQQIIIDMCGNRARLVDTKNNEVREINISDCHSALRTYANAVGRIWETLQAHLRAQSQPWHLAHTDLPMAISCDGRTVVLFGVV